MTDVFEHHQTNLNHQHTQQRVLTRAAAARARLLHSHQNQPDAQLQRQQPSASSDDHRNLHPLAAPSHPGDHSELLVHAYAAQIHDALLDREARHLVDPDYMSGQRDVNSTMRGILVDWLVEVGEEYKLQTETLFLAVNYIDRFLSYVPVARAKLQLVGVACMLVASKFEDVHPPAVDEFVYISDNTYLRDEVLQMEGALLSRLEFNLSVVTAVPFLRRYARLAQVAAQADPTIAALASYLLELTLQEYAFLKYRPSERAAAALWLAMYTARLPCWTPAMEAATGYAARQLHECAAELHAVFRNAESNSLQAVREKYSHAKYLCVSLLRPPHEAPPLQQQ